MHITVAVSDKMILSTSTEPELATLKGGRSMMVSAAKREVKPIRKRSEASFFLMVRFGFDFNGKQKKKK